MRLASKILKIFGISLLALIILIFVLKDFVIKTAVCQVGSSVMGAQLEIGQFSWNVFIQKVVIKNLKINNPPGFEKLYFIDIPQIILQYDLSAMLQGKLHMPLVLVNLKEMIVIKNQEGHLNVDALKVVHPAATEKKEKVEVPHFQIDVLKLNVGKVIFKDYYKKETPALLVYDLNLKDKTFKDVNSVEKMITVIIVQAMKPTAIQGAGMYAAAALMGVGFIPGVALGVIVAKDDAVAEFTENFDKVFAVTESFIKEKGTIKSVDKGQGMMQGTVDGVGLKVKIEKVEGRKTRLTVAGRKFMLAKKEFAAGILYQISQRLSH